MSVLVTGEDPSSEIFLYADDSKIYKVLFNQSDQQKLRDTFTLEVPVVIRLTCDCAVADDAVMPIRAESSS